MAAGPAEVRLLLVTNAIQRHPTHHHQPTPTNAISTANQRHIFTASQRQCRRSEPTRPGAAGRMRPSSRWPHLPSSLLRSALFTCLPLPLSAFHLPFLDLSLRFPLPFYAFLCLSLTIHCLPLLVICRFLTFHCLSLRFPLPFLELSLPFSAFSSAFH